jgi:hypothetical protein
MVGTVKFETRIKELVENLPDLAVLVEPLLIVRRVRREQFGILHRWNTRARRGGCQRTFQRQNDGIENRLGAGPMSVNTTLGLPWMRKSNKPQFSIGVPI